MCRRRKLVDRTIDSLPRHHRSEPAKRAFHKLDVEHSKSSRKLQSGYYKSNLNAHLEEGRPECFRMASRKHVGVPVADLLTWNIGMFCSSGMGIVSLVAGIAREGENRRRPIGYRQKRYGRKERKISQKWQPCLYIDIDIIADSHWLQSGVISCQLAHWRSYGSSFSKV